MLNNIKFSLGDKVKINTLDGLKGRIVSIWITQHGIKYEVRYFYNCDSKQIYFYEDELEKINV